MKTYRTKNNYRVEVCHGGIGAENSFLPQTNDTEIYFIIQSRFNWTPDIDRATSDLDVLAQELGFIEEKLSPDELRQKEDYYNSKKVTK